MYSTTGRTMTPNNDRRFGIAEAAVLEALGNLHRVPGESLRSRVLRTDCVGSTYIRDAEDRDVDVLVLIPDQDLDCLRIDQGWAYGGSIDHSMLGDHWASWTKSVDGVDVNMLLVNDAAYYHQWVTSAEVCRFLHLKGLPINAGTTHGVHEIIMDYSTAEIELPRRNYP